MIGKNDRCEGNARDGGGLSAARTEHTTDSAMVCTNERVISVTRAVCRCCLPVHGGCLHHVEHLICDFMSLPLDPQVLSAACKAGASERILEMILSRTAPDWASAIYDAAKGGHLHVFRWMTEREDGRGPWRGDFKRALEIAARSGHFELVRWLYDREIDYWNGVENPFKNLHGLPRALEVAARNGHLDIVQWLYGAQKDKNWIRVMGEAVAGGHLTVAEWLYEFRESMPTLSTSKMDEAAKSGHLDMLQWLHSIRLLRVTSQAVDGAAENGHLDVVQWLHANQLGVCTSDTLFLATVAGHLAVAKWVNDNMCVSTDVSWGLSYSRVPSASIAAACGHLDILEWLHEDIPGAFTEHDMGLAAHCGQLDAIKWLHRHRNAGCTLEAPYQAASTGKLEIVQWLHEHYSDSFSACVMDGAATNGHLEVIRWLHENRTEGCTTVAMDWAALNGHLDVMVWLLIHTTEGFSRDVVEAETHVEILCSFEDALGSTADAEERDQLKLLQEVHMRRPEFVQRCFQCMAKMAIRNDWDHIFVWLKKFGIKMRSEAPVRTAVITGCSVLAQWFHRNGFEIREPQLAVQHGSLHLAFWLWEIGCEIDLSELILTAVEIGNVPFARKVIERGGTLDLAAARKLAVNYNQVEATSWLNEQDRVQLVLESVNNENHELLWWLVVHTDYQQEASRIKIHKAIQNTNESIRKWLMTTIHSPEVHRWCFQGPALK